MKIDAHQQFWRYNESDYQWIRNDRSVLRRDFLPRLFRSETISLDIDAAIAVQACARPAETDWLLDLAEQHTWILGVIGWTPLTDPRASEHIQRLATTPCVGLRHNLRDDPNPDLCADPEFNRGIALLQQHNLTFDLLIAPEQLPAIIDFVDAHPNQTFVLNHLANPDIASGSFERWAEHFAAIAEREHVCAKLSGLVTRAHWQRWTELHLRPYLDTALACFGTQRLLFGSDWPCLQLASSYERWLRVLERHLKKLTPMEQRAIFGDNARRVYHLPEH